MWMNSHGNKWLTPDLFIHILSPLGPPQKLETALAKTFLLAVLLLKQKLEFSQAFLLAVVPYSD